MRGGALLLAALAIAGCGSSMPTRADKGDPKASKAVKVEAVRAWLDPEELKDYDDSAVVVVRNTSDKVADGVTIKVKWEKPVLYETKQDEAIVVPPRSRGVFVLGPFDAPPEVKGQPTAEAKVDRLQPRAEPAVEFSDFKQSGCDLTGSTTNKFKKTHPAINGLVAGLKDGKIVTGGSIFFEEPGLLPGKEGKFKATLEPLCPKGTVDEWVAFANLSVEDLQDP